MLLHSPRLPPLMPPTSPAALISVLAFSTSPFLPELTYTFTVPAPFAMKVLLSIAIYWLLLILPLPHWPLRCWPFTSAALRPQPLLFADAERASLFPRPAPWGEGAPCAGRGAPVPLGVSRGRTSTLAGKPLHPLLRVSKFPCIAEARDAP